MKLTLLLFIIGAMVGCGSAVDFDRLGGDSGWEARVAAAESMALSGDDSASSQKNLGIFDGISVGGGLVGVSLHLPTAQGTIASRLWLSPECLLKRDRRLVALVPGTLANGASYYEVSVPGRQGFNSVRVLAKAGYCALAVDLLGTGESDRPEIGMDLGTEASSAAIAAVARPVATALGVRKWDVYGETGVGTNTTLQLARRPDVRTIVASATFYKRFGPVSAQLFDPAYQAFAAVTPYFPGDPVLLPLFFGAAYPDVLEAAVEATLGPAPHSYPTGPLNELASIPFSVDPATGEFVMESSIVDAGPAKADALFIQGTPDFIGSEAGTAEMVSEYGLAGGGDAMVVTIPGASHLMRFDAAISDGPASPFWAPILDFLADH